MCAELEPGDGAAFCAELDRIAPYATTVVRTPEDLLPDLDLQLLLMREDFIPPVPGDEDDMP